MSAEFPATKQFIVDVAIAQMSKPIFSRPLLILAINFNTTADVCSTLHTLSNTFIIFFETDLIIDSMVDFIVLVISLVTSSAAVFDNAETTAPIATEHITASRIVLNFSFDKPKIFNKLKIFEFANLINSKLPGLKVTVKNVSHLKIDVAFSLEYLLPDNLFININFNNDLEIISTGSALFEEMLKGTKGILDN